MKTGGAFLRCVGYESVKTLKFLRADEGDNLNAIVERSTINMDVAMYGSPTETSMSLCLLASVIRHSVG